MFESGSYVIQFLLQYQNKSGFLILGTLEM